MCERVAVRNASATVDTIRRELALHGRVCKYIALSALRVKTSLRNASAEIAVVVSTLDAALRGRLMAASHSRGLAPSPCEKRVYAEMFLSRNILLYTVSAVY